VRFEFYLWIKEKGKHKALKRFDFFKRKVSPRRFPKSGFILKADIKDYYPSVVHTVLISLIEKKVKDKDVIWLVRRFLENHSPNGKGLSVGWLLS